MDRISDINIPLKHYRYVVTNITVPVQASTSKLNFTSISKVTSAAVKVSASV